MYGIWRAGPQVACKSRTYTKAPGTEHACKAKQPAVSRRHSLTDRMSHGHSILQCFTAGDSVITTSFTGVKSCKYQYFTERANRVLFGHNQPRSVGVIRSIETLHAGLRYRVTPVSQVLIKRFISNVYRKVHWHGTTEKPKVRNGAGLFKYKSTQQYPLHLMIEMKFILALLYMTAIQDGPSRVLLTLPITL